MKAETISANLHSITLKSIALSCALNGFCPCSFVTLQKLECILGIPRGPRITPCQVLALVMLCVSLTLEQREKIKFGQNEVDSSEYVGIGCLSDVSDITGIWVESS